MREGEGTPFFSMPSPLQKPLQETRLVMVREVAPGVLDPHSLVKRHRTSFLPSPPPPLTEQKPPASDNMSPLTLLARGNDPHLYESLFLRQPSFFFSNRRSLSNRRSMEVSNLNPPPETLRQIRRFDSLSVCSPPPLPSPILPPSSRRRFFQLPRRVPSIFLGSSNESPFLNCSVLLIPSKQSCPRFPLDVLEEAGSMMNSHRSWFP